MAREGMVATVSGFDETLLLTNTTSYEFMVISELMNYHGSPSTCLALMLHDPNYQGTYEPACREFLRVLTIARFVWPSTWTTISRTIWRSLFVEFCAGVGMYYPPKPPPYRPLYTQKLTAWSLSDGAMLLYDKIRTVDDKDEDKVEACMDDDGGASTWEGISASTTILTDLHTTICQEALAQDPARWLESTVWPASRNALHALDQRLHAPHPVGTMIDPKIAFSHTLSSGKSTTWDTTPSPRLTAEQYVRKAISFESGTNSTDAVKFLCNALKNGSLPLTNVPGAATKDITEMPMAQAHTMIANLCIIHAWVLERDETRRWLAQMWGAVLKLALCRRPSVP